MTYCLVGNGLTIMADEEYLTISSTLDHQQSFQSNQATQTPLPNLASLSSQTQTTSSSFSQTSNTLSGLSQTSNTPSSFPQTSITPAHRSQTSQNPKIFSQTSNTLSSFSSQNPNATMSPLNVSSDTLTTCALAHPSQPLTTQPSKAKQYPLQQGQQLPLQYKAPPKNSQPAAGLPQNPAPPAGPITTQIISSTPPNVSATPPTIPPTIIPPPTQSHAQWDEKAEKKERESRDEEEDEEDEEERQRKVILFTDLQNALMV